MELLRRKSLRRAAVLPRAENHVELKCRLSLPASRR